MTSLITDIYIFYTRSTCKFRHSMTSLYNRQMRTLFFFCFILHYTFLNLSHKYAYIFLSNAI